MDQCLQSFQPLDILRLCGRNGSAKLFLPARPPGVQPPAAPSVHGNPEAGRSSDRADDRAGIHPNLIRRTGQPISPAGGNILDKGVNRRGFLCRQPPRAPRSGWITGLSPRRVHHQRHRCRLHPKGFFDDRRQPGITQRIAPRYQSCPSAGSPAPQGISSQRG